MRGDGVRRVDARLGGAGACLPQLLLSRDSVRSPSAQLTTVHFVLSVGCGLSVAPPPVSSLFRQLLEGRALSLGFPLSKWKGKSGRAEGDGPCPHTSG